MPVSRVLPDLNVAKSDASFYELYAKATYTMGDWAFGPTFFYAPNFSEHRRRRRIPVGHREVHRAVYDGAV